MHFKILGHLTLVCLGAVEAGHADPRQFTLETLPLTVGTGDRTLKVVYCHDPRLKYRSNRIGIGLRKGSFEDPVHA